jgi:hypothetical protein
MAKPQFLGACCFSPGRELGVVGWFRNWLFLAASSCPSRHPPRGTCERQVLLPSALQSLPELARGSRSTLQFAGARLLDRRAPRLSRSSEQARSELFHAGADDLVVPSQLCLARPVLP